METLAGGICFGFRYLHFEYIFRHKRHEKSSMKILHSSDPELKGVFNFSLAFAGAVKNYTLYPKDHAIAKKHLLNFSRHLTRFLADYDCLRLDVEKNRLWYNGEIVYQGTDEEGDIAYLLGRDGVQYLEFKKGIELWEIQSILKIINEHRMLDEENDGDIVTALWEQDYPHIGYKAIDILSLDAPAINFSGFKVAPPPADTEPSEVVEDTGVIDGAGVDEQADYEVFEGDFDAVVEEEPSSVTLAITARGNDLWVLSPLERYELEKMVAAEEQLDTTDNVIDILLIILVLQNDRQDFISTIDFLQDRFLHACTIRRFDADLKILNNLRTIRCSFGDKKKWALPLLDGFLHSVSRPESLREAKKILLDPKTPPYSQQMEYFWRVLCQLSPEVIFTLGPLLPDIPSARIRQSLSSVIVHHGQRAPDILAKAVPQFDEELCLQLLPVVRKMVTEQGTKVFMSMALHDSVVVRARAFDILERRGRLDPLVLFPLINDPDKAIRTKILELLMAQRNEQYEQRLLAYLQNGESTIADKDHLVACYRALGCCGSAALLPVLQDILMGGKLGEIFNRQALHHKQGAAIALRELQIIEANQILEEGAAGILPDVRLACKKALGK